MDTFQYLYRHSVEQPEKPLSASDGQVPAGWLPSPVPLPVTIGDKSKAWVIIREFNRPKWGAFHGPFLLGLSTDELVSSVEGWNPDVEVSEGQLCIVLLPVDVQTTLRRYALGVYKCLVAHSTHSDYAPNDRRQAYSHWESRLTVFPLGSAEV